MEDHIMLSKEDLRAIVREEFNGALTAIGFDTSEPVELQQDQAFLRDWRKTTETVRRKSLVTIVGLFITGCIGLLWVGVQEAFSKIPH
jgi:hypothetical protein